MVLELIAVVKTVRAALHTFCKQLTRVVFPLLSSPTTKRLHLSTPIALSEISSNALRTLIITSDLVLSILSIYHKCRDILVLASISWPKVKCYPTHKTRAYRILLFLSTACGQRKRFANSSRNHRTVQSYDILYLRFYEVNPERPSKKIEISVF